MCFAFTYKSVTESDYGGIEVFCTRVSSRTCQTYSWRPVNWWIAKSEGPCLIWNYPWLLVFKICCTFCSNWCHKLACAAPVITPSDFLWSQYGMPNRTRSVFPAALLFGHRWRRLLCGSQSCSTTGLRTAERREMTAHASCTYFLGKRISGGWLDEGLKEQHTGVMELAFGRPASPTIALDPTPRTCHHRSSFYIISTRDIMVTSRLRIVKSSALSAVWSLSRRGPVLRASWLDIRLCLPFGRKQILQFYGSVSVRWLNLVRAS